MQTVLSLSRVKYCVHQNNRFFQAVRKYSVVGQLPPFGKAFFKFN